MLKDPTPVEGARPEAARRFRELMATRRGAATPAASFAPGGKGDAPGSADHAGAGVVGAGSHAWADVTADTGADARANARDETRTDAEREAGNDTGNDNDADSTRDDTTFGDVTVDKRSWGVRLASPLPASPPHGQSGQRSSSANATAALGGSARRPPRARAAFNVAAGSAHPLREPFDGDDSSTSRAETLSHLVARMLARHAPADHDQIHKPTREQTDAGADSASAGSMPAISIRVDHVFPNTLLTLTISESALSLRFQSGSPESRALLFDQRCELSLRVTNRTGRATHIDIVA
ncbi:MAG: type III secretion HpaP family protein [Janthinobacterium lividum]